MRDFLRTLPLLLLLGSISLSCSSTRLSTVNREARDAYHEAMEFRRLGGVYLTKAADALQRAISADPGFYEAYRELGRLHDERANFRKANEYYGRSLQINRNQTDLYLIHGRSLFNEGRYGEALAQFTLYRRYVPADLEGLSWLAHTARMTHSASAESLLTELTRLDSLNADGWLSLAEFYFDREDWRRAAGAYAKADRLGQLERTSAIEYAECLMRIGAWDEAQTFLEQVVGSYPDQDLAAAYLKAVQGVQGSTFDPRVLELYLEAKFLRGEVDLQAEQSFRPILERLGEAIRLESGFVPALRELASLASQVGSDSLSLIAYRRLKGTGHATAADYANLAFLHFKKNELEEARTEYETSWGLDSSQTEIKDYLSTIGKMLRGEIKRAAYDWYTRGLSAAQLDSSEYFLQRAVAEDSSYSEALLHLGLVELRRAKYREAEQTLTQGLRWAGDDRIRQLFHFNLGLVYFQMDFHDKAIREFSSVLALDSLDGDALYYLARTYADKSDMAQAIKAYDRLVLLFPDYFRPGQNDLEEVGVESPLVERPEVMLMFAPRLQPGHVNYFKLQVRSEGDAVLGADANGHLSRELTIAFRELVLDVTEYGEAELALDILSVQGRAATPKEKRSEGQRFYLRMSDVFGVTNIYGLIEDDPYSLPRLVISVMENLHGSFLRKNVYAGEMWRSKQYVFKLGSVDAVTALTEVSGQTARALKYYGILGSYDAARYGDVGRVSVHNKGEMDFDFDLTRRLIVKLHNRFTTKTFSEATGKLETQSADYTVTLTGVKTEKLEKPKKIVLDGVPYVKQHGPQCAAASLSMILSFYKQSIDQDDIYAAIKSDYAGAQSLDIIRYPRSLKGYKSFGYIGTLEDLKGRIDEGIPVMVFLTPFGYGHVVVAIGYDETKHQIIMHDPTVASMQAVSYDQFLEEWRQSGNECAIVLPFDQDIVVTEGPIASHGAVETKWEADKAFGQRSYEKAMELYREALAVLPNYEGALEGIMLIHLSRDEFAKAESLLDTLLTINPTSIDLILRRASLLLSQYDYDKVLQLTRKAKQLDETNIINYVYSASALFSQKKFQEAINEIKEAIRINPLQSTPRNMLASFLAETGEFEKAYEQAQLSLRYEPENAGNYISLSGVSLAEVNNRFLTGEKRAKLIQKALEATDHIRRSNPSFPSLDQLYGDIYAAGHMNAVSESLYAENIRKFPEENSAYNNYAWYLATRSVRLWEAQRLSEKSIELSQRNPYYFDTMAWIHLKMAVVHQSSGRVDSALYYLRLAENELKATIEYDRYSDFAYRHLAAVYFRWGRVEDALAQIAVVMEMLPDKARLCTDTGKDLEECGMDSMAALYYLNALEFKPTLDYAAYRAALLLARQGLYERSLALIRQAQNQDSSNAVYVGGEGVIRYLMGQYDQAFPLLEASAAGLGSLQDPEAVEYHYYLGMLYRQKKINDKAKEQFHIYLQKAPEGRFAGEIRGMK